MKKINLLQELEQRFGAEVEKQLPNKDGIGFLEERNELEEVLSWNLDAVVQHFQLIKQYGLKDKLLE